VKSFKSLSKLLVFLLEDGHGVLSQLGPDLLVVRLKIHGDFL
jgi:hypothetical protein